MAITKKKIRFPRAAEKIKWGVAGCGFYTENTFLPTLSLLKRSKFVAIYSSDKDRAKTLGAKFGSENYFDDFKEFLKSDIDVVYIGSKNSDHHWQVIEAAKAGKHILCEKPIALSSEQAEDMVKECVKNGVVLSLNYPYRFHPLVMKAKELIDKQMLGRIISINVSFNINFAPNSNFRFKREQSGGGAFRDLGTHMIDLLRYFGGEISEIMGSTDNVVYNCEVDDFANGIVKFEKSGYGQFTVSYNTKKAFNRIEILGYKGSICIENLIGSKSGSGKITIDLENEARKSFRKRANKLLLLLKDIQKKLKAGEVPKITGDDGLINMQLMEKMEEGCGKEKSS